MVSIITQSKLRAADLDCRVGFYALSYANYPRRQTIIEVEVLLAFIFLVMPCTPSRHHDHYRNVIALTEHSAVATKRALYSTLR